MELQEFTICTKGRIQKNLLFIFRAELGVETRILQRPLKTVIKEVKVILAVLKLTLPVILLMMALCLITQKIVSLIIQRLTLNIVMALGIKEQDPLQFPTKILSSISEGAT